MRTFSLAMVHSPRLAFFYAVAFFTAVMAERVRTAEKRVRNLELRLALSQNERLQDVAAGKSKASRP